MEGSNTVKDTIELQQTLNPENPENPELKETLERLERARAIASTLPLFGQQFDCWLKLNIGDQRWVKADIEPTTFDNSARWESRLKVSLEGDWELFQVGSDPRNGDLPIDYSVFPQEYLELLGLKINPEQKQAKINALREKLAALKGKK